jgi:hypothetical protein
LARSESEKGNILDDELMSAKRSGRIMDDSEDNPISLRVNNSDFIIQNYNKGNLSISEDDFVNSSNGTNFFK